MTVGPLDISDVPAAGTAVVVMVEGSADLCRAGTWHRQEEGEGTRQGEGEGSRQGEREGSRQGEREGSRQIERDRERESLQRKLCTAL